MAQRSRIAHFKSPFLVTVAAVTVTACGGALTGEGLGWLSGSGEQPGGTSVNPPQPVCPESPPEYGSACEAAAPLECEWGDCLGAPTVFGSCDPATGTWDVAEISCNPPPPPPPIGPQPVCPESPPEYGSACEAAAPLECEWGDCLGAPTVFGSCDPATGAWDVAEISCNPPPPPPPIGPQPVCPESPPEYGSACEAAAPLECEWGDCLGAPTVFGSCDPATGTWDVAEVSCNPPPPPPPTGPQPVCPESPPEYGSACEAAAPLECEWGDCLGAPTVFGSCDPATGTWDVAEISCNPPPPCPIAESEAGSPCGTTPW